MGQLLVKGPSITEALEKLVPAALQEMVPGQIRYSQTVSPHNGGILDDLMLTRWDDANGTSRSMAPVSRPTWISDDEGDVARLNSNDLLDAHALIAVQGPEPARCAYTDDAGSKRPCFYARGLVTRAGMVTSSRRLCRACAGEDGYEISIANTVATFAEALTALEETNLGRSWRWKFIAPGDRSVFALETI